MELLAIIATLVVVVLQIITVALTIKTRKMVRELSNKQPASSFPHDKQERRDRDFRQNRRPGQDSRPKQPQAQSANGNNAADPVEKSLRDINLKLKNAERDQEFARRKIQENFPKDHPQNNRRRDFRDNRDSRDGNGDRRGGRDHRRGGNDRPRGPWQDRNNHKEHVQQQQQPSEALPEELNTTAAAAEAILPVSVPSTEPQVVMEPETQVTTPVNQDLVPSDFGTEDLQHGRKIMVKRRLLKEEEAQEGETGAVETEAQAEDSSQNETDQQQQGEADFEKADEPSEIRFGRR